MKAEFWAVDTFRFSVTGPGTFRFLNRAAASGVRLRRVRWQKDGYTATASGPDRRRLEEIAKSGGWAFTVTARRGPGRRGYGFSYTGIADESDFIFCKGQKRCAVSGADRDIIYGDCI